MRGPFGPVTGGAWLSSARVVRCWVKSRNERNPRSMLPARSGGDSWETAGVNSEEGGDDVKSSCPLCLGLQTCYNGRYKGLRYRKVERIPKSRSQFGLGSATRPHEVGVASNRRSATLRLIRSRALYTPPVTSRKSVTPEAGGPTLVEGAVEGGIGDWDEAETRAPYRKVRLDHLLSKEHWPLPAWKGSRAAPRT